MNMGKIIAGISVAIAATLFFSIFIVKEVNQAIVLQFGDPKRIIVKPGQRLSYQYHHKRNEVWVIVKGHAHITLDDKEWLYVERDIVDIPVGTKHRVMNKGKEDLIFIETQTGTYFGEDDIVRLEDDYGRDK